VTVRGGASVTVPVLDNDFSPSGEALALVGHVAGERPGRLEVQRPGDTKVPTGEAFVNGRVVRYVAPVALAEETTFTIPYLATNEAGDTAPGRLEVRVVPLEQRNQPPEPPVLEGRAVSGDTIKLKLPGVGVDPDGDSVTLLGLGSPAEGAAAPQLGRIVRLGANSLEYQAYPGSQGTEAFSYLVTDSSGATASGTVRVAVVPPGSPQPPLAVNDALTVEPGRTATIDVLANDLIAAGDRVEIELVDAPDVATLDSPTGPLLIKAPDRVDGRNLDGRNLDGRNLDGRNVEVVYTIDDGLDSSRGVVTLRTSKPYNNPPVVFDAFGPNEQGEAVDVDVLDTAYDPDGDAGDLEVTKVFAPAGVEAEVDGPRIRVERGDQPLVVPFRVEDADGAAATASLYVPAATAGQPYVDADSLIRLKPGESKDLDLGDYVTTPGGRKVRFTLTDRIWASPVGDVSASITDEGSFEVTAGKDYTGPGAVAFEVTTGESVDDENGVRAVLSVPVQVGDTAPILRCPGEAIEVAQGERVDLDVAALCHVWTAVPEDAGSLDFAGSFQGSAPGLEVQSKGSVVGVTADGAASPGTEATLELTADGSEPGQLVIRVVNAPRPSLAPIRVADMKAGEERVIDLARYLSPGVSDPEPTLVSVQQLTRLDIRATRDGTAGVRLVTGPEVDGHAEFRIVMSDVSGDSGPERRVEGRIALDVLDRPDTPLAPVPGNAVRSREVALSWRAPAANGAPITVYELRNDRGQVRRCGSTACSFTGLTNGEWYTFQVRARNAVGWSDWSPRSMRARPDEKPDPVRNLRVVGRGPGWVELTWVKPANKTSPIEYYEVSWGGAAKATPTGTTYTVRGLDNNLQYTFAVSAKNAYKFGDPVKVTGQSIGTPGSPAPVTATATDVAGDSTGVRVDWAQVSPPNGPGPIVYTVRKNGVLVCRTQELSCVADGIVYNGETHTFAVTATNNGGLADAQTGDAAMTTWKAVGQPADWGDWTVAPTGNDNQATATFTVPNSRGAQSDVTILVDGAPSGETFPARGAQTRTFGVPNNDGQYTVVLRVCNEGQPGQPPACKDSAAKQVQTWGPLQAGHIVSATANVSGTSVSWTITVDTNGDPADVRVTSNRGRDESFAANTVNTFSFTTRSRDIGYSTSERITVELRDPAPARGPVTKAFTSPQTQDPPPPTVKVWRGEKCNDGNSLQDCNVNGNGVNCIHSSCGFVVIQTANFNGDVTCNLDSSDGAWNYTWNFSANETRQMSAYFGYPNGWVEATCRRSGQSGTFRYSWPDS
jgi:hypothetical protein